MIGITTHEDPYDQYEAELIVRAGLKSGHHGTATLAMILAKVKPEYSPCEHCDYVKRGCRCYDAGKGTQ